MAKHKYTKIGEIWICNDCGGFSKDKNTIPHYNNCVTTQKEVGMDLDKMEKEDKEYAAYLKRNR